MKRLIPILFLICGVAFGEGTSGGSKTVVITDGVTGKKAEVDSDGQLHVVMEGKVDVNNSTTNLLGANNSYTGTVTETLAYAVMNVFVYSDVASATDGLCVDASTDGTTWYCTDNFTIPAATAKTFSFQPQARYFRVSYTNGASGQGVFDLQTMLKKTYIKPSSHRIQDSISDDDDAELAKAVLTGEDPDGVYRNVQTTSDGNLTISDNSSGLAIAKGDVSGHTFVHKFGNAPDFDTTEGEITVWDGAEDGADWENMVYNYSATNSIDSISSSSVSDTQEIVVEGLDGSGNLVTQSATLIGQTRVALSTNLWRVFRAYNNNSSNLVGHVLIYENDTLTGGVPDDPELIRAVIDPDNQQTEMAVYTIPAGKTGYMRDWYMATSGGSKSSNYRFKLRARLYGKIFRTRHTSAMEALAPVPYQHRYNEPEVFPALTDIEMTCESIASPAATDNAVSAGYDIVLIDN